MFGDYNETVGSAVPPSFSSLEYICIDKHWLSPSEISSWIASLVASSSTRRDVWRGKAQRMSVSERAAREWEPRSNPAAACCALSRFVSSQPWDFWMKNCFNTVGVIVKAAHSKELWLRRAAEEVYRKPFLPRWPNQAPLIRECDSGKTIDSSCCDALLISSLLPRRY